MKTITFYTVSDLAERLHISPVRLYQLISDGVLPEATVKVGAMRLYTEFEAANVERLFAIRRDRRRRSAHRAALLDPAATAEKLMAGQSSSAEQVMAQGSEPSGESWLTSEQVAEILGCTLPTIWEFCKTRSVRNYGCRLKSFRRGRDLAFRASDVMSFLSGLRVHYKLADAIETDHHNRVQAFVEDMQHRWAIENHGE